MFKRIFLVVLDSVGIGEAPDAGNYGDAGSNTIKTISQNPNFKCVTMKEMGLFNVDGVDYEEDYPNPVGSYGKCQEQSKGKDTTTGHWEMMGIISKIPFPTFPDGFPEELIKEFGKQAYDEKDLIVYTSADSVFQVAAHTDVIPLEELYKDCEIAREMLQGKYGVGRVIARPFTGTEGNYTRTLDRKDFSLVPPYNVLNYLADNDKAVISVGKIFDIFA